MPHKGHPISEETKRKIGIANSIALRGRKLSPETIAKRTATLKLNGYKPSLETRLKMSLARKGKPFTQKHKENIRKAFSNEFIKEMVRDKRGQNNHFWKGGRSIHKSGYVLVYCPNHPYVTHGCYVFEHRLVMEKHLGRILLPTEVVHHINGIRDDNRIENLMLFSTTGLHTTHHAKTGELKDRHRSSLNEFNPQ